MGSVYLEFARFLRNQLEVQDLSVSQCRYLCGEDIPLSNWYQWLRGERVPCSWQLRKIETRLNFRTPYNILKGTDRFGVPIKDRQLKLPGLREARR